MTWCKIDSGKECVQSLLRYIVVVGAAQILCLAEFLHRLLLDVCAIADPNS